jgi:hypothetical protein
MERPKVALFKNWILDEAEKDRAVSQVSEVRAGGRRKSKAKKPK